VLDPSEGADSKWQTVVLLLNVHPNRYGDRTFTPNANRSVDDRQPPHAVALEPEISEARPHTRKLAKRLALIADANEQRIDSNWLLTRRER